MQRRRHAAIVTLLSFLLGSCFAGSNDVRPVSDDIGSVPTETAFADVFPDRSVQHVQPMPAPEGPARLVARPFEPFLWTWRDPGPGANEAFRLAADNPFGQRVSFLVEDLFRDRDGTDWARILTGEHPNGAQAWIRARDARITPVDQRIVVDLSSRMLIKYVRGDVRARISVAIGDEDTPTVPGRYFVWARVRYFNPAGPYGKLALGLSGFSRVVQFGPAPGRLAIHGTADPSDRGQSISLGCVRVFNSQIGQLSNVPMGTPVIIRR
jgi:L,D-transpeptidase catalytic domain